MFILVAREVTVTVKSEKNQGALFSSGTHHRRSHPKFKRPNTVYLNSQVPNTSTFLTLAKGCRRSRIQQHLINPVRMVTVVGCFWRILPMCLESGRSVVGRCCWETKVSNTKKLQMTLFPISNGMPDTSMQEWVDLVWIADNSEFKLIFWFMV